MSLFNLRPLVNTTATNASLQEITANPAQFYNAGDTAFMLLSGALVFLMIPGISLIHAGSADTKSALSLFRLPLFTLAVVGCQWFFFGYDLAFSRTSDYPQWSWFGGSDGLGFVNVTSSPTGDPNGLQLPELVYSFYQEMFACFTATIVSGAVMRKMGTIQFLCFIFLWTTIVYDTIARWSWNPQGWSRSKFHTLDFAGGTVVHISSGAAATAIGIYFGLKMWLWQRYTDKDRATVTQVFEDHKKLWKPQNVSYVLLGTILLWFGWFGFNGGSELGANPRAALACVSTQTAPCFGGVTSLILHWFLYDGPIKATRKPRQERPDASQAFCDGVVIALVAITPAAGYVPVKFSPLFGIFSAIFLELATMVLDGFRDFFSGPIGQVVGLTYDPFWIGVIHSGGGLVGMFFTAVFTKDYVYGLDGYSQPPPDIYDRGALIRNQLKDATAGLFWSFVMTFILMILVDVPILIYHRRKGFIGAIGETVQERTHAIVLVQLQEYPSEP